MSDYGKPATTYEQQLEILKKRNLIIDNEAEAAAFLKNVGYFRLSGYWLTFYKCKDEFKEGTTFQHIMNVYETDRKLRQLLLSLLEDVEVSYKTMMAHCFSFHYSPLDHYNENRFVDKKFYQDWFRGFEEAVNRANRRNELYVKHYTTKYDGVFPIWVALEMESFGDISKFYNNLQPELKKIIAKQSIGFSNVYLESWLYSLAVTRNMCAHNSRLYDKVLKIKPKMQSKEITTINNSYIFAIIYTCKKVCLDKNKWNEFYVNLKNIFEGEISGVDISKYGFPEDWEKLLESVYN